LRVGGDFALEKRGGEALGKTLNDDEGGNGGEDDEGEKPRARKRESETGDTGGEVLDGVAGGERRSLLD
jgi:hypothetical protein